MKNISSPFAQFVAVVACALTLGSCNRAEYAMLPQGSSYHGVSRASTPVPAAPAPAEATPVTAEPTTAAVSEAPVAEKVAPATVATAAPAAAPAAKAFAVAIPNTAAAAAPRKLNPLQRLALNKVTRKVNKLVQKTSTARSHDNTASAARGGIDGNLRTGLILLLVGLLVGILSYIVGTIIAIIGLVFIILWLLDQA